MFVGIFVIPTAMAFFYSLTRWTLFDWEFIGLDNFRQFFREPALTKGLRNTFVYAVVTSGLKVVLGMALALLVTSRIQLKGTMRSIVFFPVLVSFVAVGITFKVMMHPTKGLINAAIGRRRPRRAEVVDRPADRPAVGRPRRRLEGRRAGDGDLHRRHRLDPLRAARVGLRRRRRGVGPLPLRHPAAVSKPATFTVILLSFIGGLRSFDLIWTMTGGGPGFTTDVLASTIFKQYQAGFYGLSTAGNVILFILVSALVFPLNWFLRRRELTS